MLRMTHGYLAVLWFVTSILLTACMGQASPPTRFFLLTAQSQGVIVGKPTGKNQGLVVELEPVEIPQYLNRPEMVTRTGGNRLRLERLNQWAGDFKEDIGRVLVENLSRIVASERVVMLPSRGEWKPDFRITTNLSRFEPDATGQVLLDARWTLFNGKGTQLLTRQSHITTKAANAEDYESLAAAMSKALGELSQEIGNIILAQ